MVKLKLTKSKKLRYSWKPFAILQCFTKNTDTKVGFSVKLGFTKIVLTPKFPLLRGGGGRKKLFIEIKFFNHLIP